MRSLSPVLSLRGTETQPVGALKACFLKNAYSFVSAALHLQMTGVQFGPPPEMRTQNYGCRWGQTGTAVYLSEPEQQSTSLTQLQTEL